MEEGAEVVWATLMGIDRQKKDGNRGEGIGADASSWLFSYAIIFHIPIYLPFSPHLSFYPIYFPLYPLYPIHDYISCFKYKKEKKRETYSLKFNLTVKMSRARKREKEGEKGGERDLK